MTALHISVSRFLEMSENRSKSARVRAIRDLARTRRAPWSAQIGRIGQTLSGRDFARSVDHRRRFAWGRSVEKIKRLKRSRGTAFRCGAQGQSPIGLLTLAIPPFFGVHVGAPESLPLAIEPLVATAVTTLPGLSHSAPASPPAPEPVPVALHPAARAVPRACAPSLAVAFAVPPSSAKASAKLPAPLETLFAFPPPPSISESASPASFAFATASPPPADSICALAVPPPVAVEVALPPPVTLMDANASLSAPLAVALALAPSSAEESALASFPDAELTALPPSSATESAEASSPEAWAIAVLGGPVEASQLASVPWTFEFVTSVLVVKHDSLSEAANAPVRATMRVSTTAAIAAPI